MIDLKWRLYGEVDNIVEDAKQLNLLGQSLSDHWQDFYPLNRTLEQNRLVLSQISQCVIRYDL